MTHLWVMHSILDLVNVLVLIYIYSSEKFKNKVGLGPFDVFCPIVSWRKYFSFFGNKSTSSCSLHWHTMLQAAFSCWLLKFSGFSAGCDFVSRAGLVWPGHPALPRGLVVQLLTLRGQRLRVTDRLPAMAVMKSRLHHASEHAETGITSSLWNLGIPDDGWC